VAEESTRDREFDYDRTVALSDGVFAIALTLLVLNIPQPPGNEDLWSELDDLLPNLGAYALSFVVIAALWRRHHIFFRSLTSIDRRLTNLNLIYLGFIALIPFPTGLIAERGDEAAAAIVYAAVIAAVTALGGFMTLHAQRKHLIRGLDAERSTLEIFSTSLVFLGSMPIALIDPTAAQLFWLTLIPVGYWSDGPLTQQGS
jgi:uncharacterized membrane protein